jgi:aspartyl-tRNA(Asn)/glutamyl-tRNA(Gln) amidotransferase subunit A
VIDEEVLFGTIKELGDGLRDGDFSVRELTKAYLDRLEIIGPKLNAVVTVTHERALATAEERDAELGVGDDRGPLHGIPYGVKDLIATAGDPTTWGAEPYRNQVFDADATVVERLESAGGVLIGKLATVELAGGFGYDQPDAAFTGPGINPWNTDAWSGGSSSGPGSAVPTGLVGFAIGTETWGSITTPAAFSGVSGLRSTYGRVSRNGVMALSWTMDKIGPMCRSAHGCGLVLREIAGPDPADPTAADRSFEMDDFACQDPPQLAVVAGAGEDEQEGVRENFERSLSIIEEFATVEEIELPDLPYEAVAGTIIDAEAASAFEDLIESGGVHDLTAPEDRIGGYSGQVVLAKDYINAMRVRTKIQQALDESLAPYDAVLTPTRTSVASPLETSFGDYFGRFGGPDIGGGANAAELPEITVPNGFGERGLPTAIGFTGRAWEDLKLLELAQEYQRRTDHVAYTDLVGAYGRKEE